MAYSALIHGFVCLDPNCGLELPLELSDVETILAESKSTNAELLHESIGTYARAVHKLDAALEAAEARFASVEDKVDAAFDKRRQDMGQEIAEFKQRLDEKTAHKGEKLATFEAELHDKFEQIAKAFKSLFG